MNIFKDLDKKADFSKVKGVDFQIFIKNIDRIFYPECNIPNVNAILSFSNPSASPFKKGDENIVLSCHHEAFHLLFEGINEAVAIL